MHDCFEELKIDAPDAIFPSLGYFDNYISGKWARGRRRARPSIYPYNLWNQYERTLINDHCTNIISEGWHNKFQLTVGKHHPSIFAALKELQKEQSETKTMLEELRLDRNIRAQKKKHRISFQTRIRTITMRYNLLI
mgnify:CR=1 FL=1